jgi:hypothetical protein
MISTLDEIERVGRRTDQQQAAAAPQPLLRFFLQSFIAAPFLLAAALFVPMVGQLLALGALGSTIWVCWYLRSMKLLLAAAIGACASLLPLMLYFSAVKLNGVVWMYVLMGLSVFVSVGYLLAVVGAIFRKLSA